MKVRHTWNLLGIMIVIIFIIIGEIIWVWDPIRVGQHIFLIDLIDYIVYLCMIPPLIWLFSAVQALRSYNKQIGAIMLRAPIVWMNLIIIISSSITLIFLFSALRHVVIIGVSIGVAFLSTLAAMLYEKWRERRKVPVFATIRSVVVIGLLAVLLTPTSYMVTYPGLTMNMNRYAQVTEVDSPSVIMGVLVFERPAFPIDWLYAQLFKHYEFTKIEPTDLPLGEQLEVVRVLKHGANQIGSALAFHKLGLGQGATWHGARVVSTLPETPAAGKLISGDVIVQLDGNTVRSVQDLMKHMGNVVPGDELELIVMRGNEQIAVNLSSQVDPESKDRAIIGIHITDETKLDLPLTVDYRPYILHEGGPSHGAMLALALIDQLTPGGIANGHNIAGTGTIGLDGSIGKIGGIEQKAYTVKRAGADVFFVPAGQEEEARRGAGSLNVVPVTTLDDILQWLQERPI